MSGYTSEVMKYIRRKTSTGFDEPVTYLGAEQRFVGGLRNSNVNNLEEQYVSGTDTITEIYKDADDNTIIEKSFHVDGSTSDYYKLVTTKYTGVAGSQFYFSGVEFVMPNDPTIDAFGDGSPDFPDTETLYLVDGNTFEFDEEILKIQPTNFDLIQKDELYFIKDNGNTELHVLTKLTGRKYTENGHREIIKESITNYL